MRVVLGYLFIMLHHCYQPPKHYQHQECNLKLNLRHRKRKAKKKWQADKMEFNENELYGSGRKLAEEIVERGRKTEQTNW